jgi:diaminopimelate decarboxylase
MYSYSNNELQWNNQPMARLLPDVAERLRKDFQYTGPFWLYQEEILKERLRLLEEGLPGCSFYYSVKSQSNLTLLSLIATHTRFGADVVSGGELYRALKAGFTPDKIVFAGVGKTEAEIHAALDLRIRSFHVESIAELKDIARIARETGLTAQVSLRLNPDVEVDTHRHITTGKEENKFGMSEADVDEAIAIFRDEPGLKLIGLQAHIGSQIFDVEPYIKTAKYMNAKRELLAAQTGAQFEYISLGGGFGVDYKQLDGSPMSFDFGTLSRSVQAIFGNAVETHFEPGRFISAPLGILASRVRHLKNRTGKVIAIIDAAMNDLIRPMLYEAYHPILPVYRREQEVNYDIVGPVCESTDTFTKGRKITELQENDWLVIGYAGAYGSCMSSNFNTRPLIPEVLLTAGGELRVIRKPQTLEQLLAPEFV